MQLRGVELRVVNYYNNGWRSKNAAHWRPGYGSEYTLHASFERRFWGLYCSGVEGRAASLHHGLCALPNPITSEKTTIIFVPGEI